MAGPRPDLAKVASLLRSKAVHNYAIVGASAAAQFLTTVLLARLAGAAVLGEFALAITTANLLTGVAILGLGRILVREVGGDLRQGETARARQVVQGFAIAVMLSSAAVAALYLLVLLATPFGARLGGNLLALALAAGLVLVDPMLRLGRALLRTTGHAVLSQTLHETPTFLKFAAIGGMALAGFSPDAPQLIGLTLLLYTGCTVAAWLFGLRTVRRWPAGGPPVPRALFAAGLPITAVLSIQAFSQWLVLAQLSATATSADVGAFRVAAQVAGVVATITMTTELYVAPQMAGDLRTGRYDLLWRRQRRGTIAMLLLASPVLLVSLFAPSAFLGLLFGPEFLAGATALSIVAFAQLVNTARGPLGALLSMSGNDRWQLALTVGGLLLVLVLSFTLSPRHGVTGAGIAYAAPFIFRSVVGWILARRLIPREAVDGRGRTGKDGP